MLKTAIFGMDDAEDGRLYDEIKARKSTIFISTGHRSAIYFFMKATTESEPLILTIYTPLLSFPTTSMPSATFTPAGE